MSVGPPLLAASLVARNRAQAIESGCCATDSWRGRLCSYHEGVEDGIYLALVDARERTEPQPLLCINCGRPMSQHGPLANCYAVAASGQ